MPLDKQIHIHSVDTSAFYYPNEKALSKKLSKLKKIKEAYKSKYKHNPQQCLKDLVTDPADLKLIRKTSLHDLRNNNIVLFNNYCSVWQTIIQYRKEIDFCNRLNKRISQAKQKLTQAFSDAVEWNNTHPDQVRVRELNNKALAVWSIISVFESTLTRTIGAKPDELCKDFMVVRVYFFDVLQDLILNGFTYNGEKYIYFSSSAGQIRTKKTVFIKESIFEKHKMSLMCGLTEEKINAQGGMNINKYLAYLALCNSASDEWKDFDIDKTIVVDDFETDATGCVDFIDDKGFSITRTEMNVPIPHTDGCGMIRGASTNFTVRLPWVKGLLSSFDFVRFITEHNASGIVKDIYGVEHNIIEEDIQIIFTKSQFKTWKYYKDWNEYKSLYKKYNCQASICCVEEEKIPYSTINYQMLQTLTDITDSEIKKLTDRSNSRIQNLTDSVDEMLSVMGVDNPNLITPYLQALKIYPEMLADPFSKEVLKTRKKSLLQKYRAGKLEIAGKYTFVIPDLYAVCEKLFLGIENPNGLLNSDEVYCSLFRNTTLDLLRSPHLYKEHALRTNNKNELTKKWFTTKGVYTSCKDLVSKVLQFDVDGDRLLVVSDKDFVSIAKRNVQGVVPLYYNMKKAQPATITNKAKYDGLVAAFVGGNIGIYSNNISKIWNDKVFQEGTEEDKQHAIDCVKRLCCQNNFVIDYAKTLYKPDFPKQIENEIKVFTSKALPHYFVYAKNKKPNQVEEKSNSFVDSLSARIKDKRLFYTTHNLADFDYTNLMSNPNIEIDEEVVFLYKSLRNKYSFLLKIIISDSPEDDNRPYANKIVRDAFTNLPYSETEVSDMLVKYVYTTQSKEKSMLWGAFGKVILANLERNVDQTKRVCKKCGQRYLQQSRELLCPTCLKKKSRPLKTYCVDCGVYFEHYHGHKNQIRCPECYKKYRREYKNEKDRFYRQQKKISETE